MSKNPETLNQYVNGYYERVNQTKSNQPLSVERWLDKGTSDTSDLDNFLKGN
jgi:phage-related minor tail protein